MKPTLLCLVAAALAATAALAGPYDQPWAIVESGDTSATRNESRLAVTKVDGESLRNTRRSDGLAPGRHTVTLHFETSRGHFRPRFVDIEMDLQACTRYRIVAHYQTTVGPDWTPRVYEEPIGECRKKFGTPPATGGG
jgi:hypothetical protein